MIWNNQPQYIYVLVRKDLPLADQVVQVGHACYDAGHFWGKKGVHLILLQVENEKELMKWVDSLNIVHIKHTTFYEPDPAEEINDQPMGCTALCTEPLHGKRREIFADCVLWVP